MTFFESANWITQTILTFVVNKMNKTRKYLYLKRLNWRMWGSLMFWNDLNEDCNEILTFFENERREYHTVTESTYIFAARQAKKLRKCLHSYSLIEHDIQRILNYCKGQIFIILTKNEHEKYGKILIYNYADEIRLGNTRVFFYYALAFLTFINLSSFFWLFILIIIVLLLM